MLSSFNSKGLCEQKRYVKRLKKYLCETYEHKVHYHKFAIDLHLKWDYKYLVHVTITIMQVSLTYNLVRNHL